MKMHTPDSDGGASAPEESSSHQKNSSAALAPAALTSSPPARRPYTSAEVRLHFDLMGDALRQAHAELKRDLADLAPRCPDADTFINGCCALTKETRAMNTFLHGIQLKIRLANPL